MNAGSCWSIILPDLTPSLSELKRRGFTPEMKDEICAIAERLGKRLGPAEHEPMNICWTLEAAATEWLANEKGGAS
jgi:hypothetical protein